MTALTRLSIAQALRRAAVRATLAPSVHNTQPWRLVIDNDSLEIHLDLTRQLPVLDPSARQARISCGCAVFNARVALAAAGYPVLVQRQPDPLRLGLLARLTVADQGRLESELSTLDDAIEARHTNRRQFTDEPVPEELVDRLSAAAAAEQADLRAIRDERQLVSAAVLSQRADAMQAADPAYRAELRAWTTDDPGRTDGVPSSAIPGAGPASFDDVPIRDFDTTGHGELPADTRSSINQCLLLLSTDADDPVAWLRAGEGLERALLVLTAEGYVAGILSQVAEVPSIRAMLRSELQLTAQPHMLLRVGRAPATPGTRRRRLADVLVEHL